MTIKKLRFNGVELSPENIEGLGGTDFTRDGEIGADSSDNELKVRLNSTTKTVVTEDQIQVLTNKSIDADTNTILNLETDNLKSGVLNTSTTLASASDTQIPSALAVKTYVDDKAAAQNEASEISYDNFISTIISTNVQGAIDELDLRLLDAETGVTNNAADITNHINDTVDAHAASAITNTPSGNLAATDVQGALNELQSDIDTISGSTGTVQTNLDNHINDTTDAHDASAISNIPSGNLAATDVQGALNELQSDINTRALDSALTSHTGATSAHGVSGAIVGTTDTQTITNKTIQGASIQTPDRLDMKQDTLANLQTYATTAANGQLVFATDTKATYVVKDSALSAVGGGSGSGINYILSPDADSGITGWVTYADAASTNPVDGTGGSPTVTFTRSTSSPLRGTASFLYTKPASNVQGQGFSYDFTIDPADTGKVLQGSFDYQIASGTFADNDLSVWIYDVTNAVMIQPAPYLLKNSGIIEKFAVEFQTAINSTSYRLIVHQGSASASAATLKFDNFNFGPQAKLYGSAITDWVSFTPTGSFTTNTTYSGKVRRIGDSAEINYTLSFSGNPNATNLLLNLPSGLVVDSLKINTSANVATIGEAALFTGGQNWMLDPLLSTTTSIFIAYSTNINLAVAALTNTAPATIAAGGTMIVTVRVPIQGWTSSQVMSADADTRVVAARAQISGAVAVSTTQPIDFASVTFDDAGGITTGSAWKYTCKVPGKYRVSTNVDLDAGTGIGLYKNGSYYSLLSDNSISPFVNGGSDTIVLVAGDYIDIRLSSGSTSTGVTVTNTHVVIERLSGPSQIMASESVIEIYSDSSGQVFPASTTYNALTFNGKEHSTHNAFNGATGVFTAPISGVYELNMITGFYGTGAVSYIDIITSTTGSSSGSSQRIHAGTGNALATMSTSRSFKLLAGQTISLSKGATYTTGTVQLFNSAAWNSMSITRTGNY